MTMGAAPHPAAIPLAALLRSQAARDGGRRRGTYRVQPQELDRLDASVLISDARVPVTLLDLSARGAGVRTDHAGGRILEQMAAAGATNQVSLELRLPDPGPPLCLSARMVQVSGDPDGLRIGLQLRPAQREAVEAWLLPLFNQRRALRVSAPPGKPLIVRVFDDQGEPLAEVRMVDLSVEGMGLELDDAAKAALSVGSAVALRFVVAGSREPVRLGAVVRHIGEDGDGQTVAGVAFDPDQGDATHARSRVGAYIVRRQLQMRRSR